MTNKITYAWGLISAQIVLGIGAWIFLGGPSLAQLIGAGLVGVIPMSTIFLLAERRFKIFGTQTPFLTRRTSAKIQSVLIIVFAILILSSLRQPIDSYSFNLSLYITVFLYAVGLEVWLVWRGYKRYESPT
jgi:hypothetical protein